MTSADRGGRPPTVVVQTLNVGAGGTGVEVGSAPDPAVHQLRAPPGDFTGRGEELEDLRAKLGEGGAIIAGLTGQGGVGKTALALVLAQELRERYPDAQIDIDLKGASAEPLAPAAVMAHVIRAFEPDAKLPESDAALAGRYRSVLDGKRALLLLDNARDREQVAPLVPPPGCFLLVTSRQHFALPGIYTRRLGALATDEAIALVRSIARRLDEGTAGELAKLCGCLPLALRAAGSALAERRDLKPARYIEQLRSAQKRLADVDAVLSESLALLEAPARQLWLRLGVFPGDFDAEAAAAVGEVEIDHAGDLLSELLRWSLLEWDEATERYRLHDLARDYARSRLDAAERYAAERRHAEHFLEVAGTADNAYERGGTALFDGLARFDREWGNIAAAQAWIAEHAERDEAAARLCCEMSSRAPEVLALRMQPRHTIQRLEAALVAAQRLGLRQGVLLGNLGNAYTEVDDLPRALGAYEQSLVHSRAIGDRVSECAALCNIGNVYAALEKPRSAIKFYEQSLVIARDISDRRRERNALSNLGNAYDSIGEPLRAIEFYEQCIALAAADDLGGASTNWNLGLIYEKLGNLSRAIELMQVLVDFERAIGHPDAAKDEAKVNELRARLAAQQSGEGEDGAG